MDSGRRIYNDYKVGDIIYYERWSQDYDTPKLFKCTKADPDWGVVYWEKDGKEDSVGIAYVRLATAEEIKEFREKKLERIIGKE